MSALSAWLLEQWLLRGWFAWLMWPVQAVFALLVILRRKLYQKGVLVSQKLNVPVIVVGNRVAGGAGKTPTVIAVVKHLQNIGWTPGVLSRGYGRRLNKQARALYLNTIVDIDHAPALNAGIVGDEPWLIWQKTQAPLAIGRNRFRMAQQLLAQQPSINILVSDDGLQHWALCRDIEIVLFDERGQGNGWLLPAGPLREPINAPPGPACQQPSLVLYNAQKPSTPLPGFMAKHTLHAPQPLKTWWSTESTSKVYRPASANLSVLTSLLPEQCWAVAGIAQPQRFFNGLRLMGLHFTPCPRPDHDLLNPLPWPTGVAHVIVTEKDAIKITPERVAIERPGCQVWVVRFDLQAEATFWSKLDEQLSAIGQNTPTPLTTEI